MDYEKKYKEALEKAKRFLTIEGVSPNEEPIEAVKRMSENIFPELAESEDEKIRKVAIEFVRQNKSFDVLSGIKKEDVIAWLEKQGDQKPIDVEKLLKDEYKKGWDKALHQLPKEVDSQIWQIANNSAKTWEESFAIMCASKKAYEKGKADALKEQKPAEWSEEDEKMYQSALWHVKNSCGNGGKNSGEFEVYSWLKSLRSHKQWKPTDEMLEALYRAISENVKEKSEDEVLLDKLYQGLKYGKILKAL